MKDIADGKKHRFPQDTLRHTNWHRETTHLGRRYSYYEPSTVNKATNTSNSVPPVDTCLDYKCEHIAPPLEPVLHNIMCIHFECTGNILEGTLCNGFSSRSRLCSQCSGQNNLSRRCLTHSIRSKARCTLCICLQYTSRIMRIAHGRIDKYCWIRIGLRHMNLRRFLKKVS